MRDFKNKVAVITGAGSGMGRDLAIQFADRGAKVAINDWNEQTLLETADMVQNKGGDVFAKHFDVSDRFAVEGFAEEVVAHFGQVDIVINNAGYALPAKSIELTNYDDFEQLMGVNMWGVIYGSKAFLPHLKKRPEAVLMNTSSVFGLFGYPTQGPYCTAKFAVRGFTETLRLELELEGIKHVKVCCIHPGGIQTGIVKNIDHSNSLLTKEEIKEANKTFMEYAPTSSAEAAAIIIKAIEQEKPKLLIGKDARWMDIIVRIFPTKYHKFLLKGLNDNKETLAKAFTKSSELHYSDQKDA